MIIFQLRIKYESMLFPVEYLCSTVEAAQRVAREEAMEELVWQTESDLWWSSRPVGGGRRAWYSIQPIEPID